MPTHTIRIWDLPTRLFHWLLAASVVALVVTAKVGGNAMVWHFRLGYVVLALLAFRLVWAWWAGAGRALPALCPRPAACGATCEAAVPRQRAQATRHWGRCRCWHCWGC